MIFKFIFAGCCFWGVLIITLYCIRTKSRIHAETMEIINRKKILITLFVMVLTILACTLPMGLCPIWNGEEAAHRNQYEVITESFINGHLYFEYDVDPVLLEMENPYDCEARNALGVFLYWDHALYNGRYYMYFGVVPVIILFLPYRIIMGTSLVTYHATQIFAGAFISGVFATFYLLTKKFFNKIPFVMYIFLSVAFSAMSVWYSIGAPALYCTAITSALCMEIWSLFFFIKAVWIEENEKKSIIFAFLGSLFGALAFGCRPPIALANLLVLPMLAEYIRKRHFSFKLLGRLVFAAVPYIVVGIVLMVYNYMRFDNPFEFGQSYQLTVTDQRAYADFWAQFDLIKTINGILENFISYKPFSDQFPYISNDSGAFIKFPLLFFSVIGLMNREVREELRKKNLGPFISVLVMLPLLITIIDITCSPSLMERYRMDIYWLMGIAAFFVTGFYYMCLPAQSQRRFSHRIAVWSLVTVFTCFWLFIVPIDNYTAYYPDALLKFKYVLLLGR